MTKVSKGELDRLKRLQEATNQASVRMHDLHIQQVLIEREIQEAKSEFYERIDEQESHLKELYEKYGEGSLDIETGEITS